MSEYIKREKLLNAIIDLNKHPAEKRFSENEVVKAINAVPAAPVEPVVRGEWKPDDRMFGVWHCSVCGESALCNGIEEEVKSVFCPHCGAKMNLN